MTRNNDLTRQLVDPDLPVRVRPTAALVARPLEDRIDDGRDVWAGGEGEEDVAHGIVGPEHADLDGRRLDGIEGSAKRFEQHAGEDRQHPLDV